MKKHTNTMENIREHYAKISQESYTNESIANKITKHTNLPEEISTHKTKDLYKLTLWSVVVIAITFIIYQVVVAVEVVNLIK